MKICDMLEQNKISIINQYNNGENTNSISKLYNCNPGSVYLKLKEWSVNIRTKGNYGTVESRREELIDLFKKGHSAYKIGKITGLAKITVLKFLKQEGLSTANKSTARKDPVKNHSKEIIQMYNDGLSTNKIADIYKCSDVSVYRLLVDNNIQIRDKCKYDVNDNYFNQIDTNEKAYILGFMITDGWITKNENRINLCITDLEILERIKQALQYTGPILFREKRTNKHLDQHMLCISSKQLKADLVKLGCDPAKTFTTTWPTLDQVPKEFIKSYILGLLDGDGCIKLGGKGRNGGYVSWIGTKELYTGLESWIKQELPELHTAWYRSKKAKVKNKNTHTLMIYQNSSVLRFLDWLYTNQPIYLQRKYDKYLQLKQNYQNSHTSNENGV